MALTLPARWVRIVGGVLPALAVLCCAPSVARASCGDYVTVRLPHAAGAATAGHPPEMPVPMPGATHKPCHGPNCSGDPNAPQPLSLPTVTSPAPSEWGWLSVVPPPVPPHAGACLADLSAPRPTHLASGIFHPPRAA